jgi:hypothetical protein
MAEAAAFIDPAGVVFNHKPSHPISSQLHLLIVLRSSSGERWRLASSGVKNTEKSYVNQPIPLKWEEKETFTHHPVSCDLNSHDDIPTESVGKRL